METQLDVMQANKMSKLKKVNILIYGGSGTGKTYFACTFSEGGKVIVLDFDLGMLTVKGWDDVSYKSFEETMPRPTAYNEFMKFLTKLEKEVNEDVWQTVVLDSLTTFSASALNGVMHNSNKVGQQPTFPEWGEQMRRIDMLIQRVLPWKCNFILTAHEEFQKDEITGKLLCLPMVTGKLSNRIGLNFDEVYHTSAVTKDNETQYQILTKSDRYYTAKSRLGYATTLVDVGEHKSKTSGYNVVMKVMNNK